MRKQVPNKSAKDLPNGSQQGPTNNTTHKQIIRQLAFPSTHQPKRKREQKPTEGGHHRPEKSNNADAAPDKDAKASASFSNADESICFLFDIYYSPPEANFR